MTNPTMTALMRSILIRYQTTPAVKVDARKADAAWLLDNLPALLDYTEQLEARLKEHEKEQTIGQ